MMKLLILFLGLILVTPILLDQAFAQSSERSPGLLLDDIMTKVFMIYLVLFIPGLIGIFIVLKVNGNYSKSIAKKITIGSVLILIGLFIFFGFTTSFMSDDEKAIWDEEKRQREFKSLQESIAQREKEEELNRQKAELEQQKELQKQSSLQADRLQGLPVSCDGVVTTETYLYPTADQCIKDLTQGFSVWCLSEERKLAEQGAEDRAKLCMRDIALRLVELCEEPVIGSQELCLMNSMQHLYKGMIQK